MQYLVRLGHHDGSITWPRYESSGLKSLSKDTKIHCPVYKLNRKWTNADNLAVDNLRSHPLSCDISVKSLYEGHNSALCPV